VDLEHGRGAQAWTTGEAPLHLFHENEQARLQPLPAEPFRLLEIRPVKVHPDCHVVILGSFYSVPLGILVRN